MSWQVDLAEILEAIATTLRQQAARLVMDEPERLTLRVSDVPPAARTRDSS